MRFLLSCLIGLLSSIASAQNVDIIYSNYYDSSLPITRESRLVVNKEEQKAFYQELFSSTKNVEDKAERVESTVGRAQRDMDTYIITDKECNRVILDDFVSKKYTIIDNNVMSDWEISEDYKMIEDFKVYKATTTFRGRKWTAWFSPELPFPYGPWKFCGLPGLILEVSDESKIFNFSALSINLNSSKKIELPNSQNFKKVNIQEFISLRDDFYNNIMQRVGGDDRNVTVTREINLRAGIESKFEWE